VVLSCNESSKCRRGYTPLLYEGGRKPKPSAFLFVHLVVCASGTVIPLRVQLPVRPYVGSAPWSHHREYRAGQGEDHCGHGDGVAGRWAGDARPDAAISEGLVALRGTRCGQGFLRQVHHEADGTRLRESRRRETRPESGGVGGGAR